MTTLDNEAGVGFVRNPSPLSRLPEPGIRVAGRFIATEMSGFWLTNRKIYIFDHVSVVSEAIDA